MSRSSAVTLFKAISYIGIYGGLLMPLVFIPVVIFPFVFSKLVYFQILIGLTFPAYVALAWMEPQYRPPKSALYVAIIAYFVAIGLSVIFSVDVHRSWWGNQERMNGFFTMLHLFAWLTMTVGIMKRWIDWEKLLNYEIVLSLIMALVAILQKPYPKLLVFEAGPRVGGLLDNPIYMGLYQIFNLSFIALLFLKTKNRVARYVYIAIALVDLAAFFLTQSRGAFFGLLAVIGSFALYYAFFTKNWKARIGILGGAGAAFGLYLLAYLFRASSFIASNPILNRLTNLQATTETRLIAWEIAWKGFLERPLTGWGFDAFHILFNLKYNPKSLEFGYYETWFDRSHNTIMDVLSMTGIFGFITYLSIFVAIFALVWRARKRGWIDLPIAAILTALPIGYFLQNLFVFDHPAAFAMSFLLFALVITATRPAFIGQQDADLEQKKKGDTKPVPWIAFGILQLILLGVVWNYSIQPFRASMLAIRANNYLGAGILETGDALIRQAGSISTPYDDEQVFLLSRDIMTLADQGTYSQYPKWRELYQYAKDINERHLKIHDKNAHPMFVYARLLHTIAPMIPDESERAMELAAAEAMYLKAIEWSPKRQQIHFGLARFYSQIGQVQKSYDVLKRTVSFNENVGESLWYLGLVEWVDLQREREGTENVIKAVNAKSPYQLPNVISAYQLARAASIQGDLVTLRSVMSRLPLLQGGTLEMYIEIAKLMETNGLTEERNQILNALTRIDPAIALQFEALATGEVSTIQASLDLAKERMPVVATTTPVSTSTVPSNATSTGPGPRR